MGFKGQLSILGEDSTMRLARFNGSVVAVSPRWCLSRRHHASGWAANLNVWGSRCSALVDLSIYRKQLKLQSCEPQATNISKHRVLRGKNVIMVRRGLWIPYQPWRIDQWGPRSL